MLIEGKNAVRQVLESDMTVNKLLVDKVYANRKDDVLNLAFKKHIRVEFMPKIALDKRSQTSHHQGYILEAVDFQYSSIDDMLKLANSKREKPFIILLDGIEDPHNLGAIIRSCECAGVHGIVIPKNRACNVNETVIRTSTGAISNVLIARVTNLKDTVNYLKEQGLSVFVAETGGKNIYTQNLDLPLAVIIGSEGQGVKKTLRELGDATLTLPLKGKVNSLNASVACGVVVFEILRQREK